MDSQNISCTYSLAVLCCSLAPFNRGGYGARVRSVPRFPLGEGRGKFGRDPLHRGRERRGAQYQQLRGKSAEREIEGEAGLTDLEYKTTGVCILERKSFHFLLLLFLIIISIRNFITFFGPNSPVQQKK